MEPGMNTDRSSDEVPGHFGGFDMLLKILGGIVLIWLAFVVLGWIFSAFKWMLIIAAGVTIGMLIYGAIKGKTSSSA